MMDTTHDTAQDIGALVADRIHTLLVELDEDDVVAVEATSALRDLGMDSLMLARLIIELEDDLGVEPFRSGEASVADLRSVGDLAQVYEDALRHQTAGSAS
jgi:acyl carrier protein